MCKLDEQRGSASRLVGAVWLDKELRLTEDAVVDS